MDHIRDHIATLVQQYDVLVLLLLNTSMALLNPNQIAIPLAPKLPSARFFGSMVWSQEANERFHKVELLLTKETLLKENEDLFENARYFENI